MTVPSAYQALRRHLFRLVFFSLKCTTNRLTMGTRVMATLPDGRIVLVRHVYEPGWHFPGGAVDYGETMQEGALRELREETGLTKVQEITPFAIYHNVRTWPGDHVQLYVVTLDEMLVAPVHTREIAEVGAFALDDLPDGTTAATRRRLDEVQGRSPVDALW